MKSVTRSPVMDMTNEFSLLVELINNLWNGCDTETAGKALKMAFEQGLEDGKLWIDEYTTMRIAQALNGNDVICFPLAERDEMSFEGDTSANLYDALHKFDSNLSYGLRNIHNSVTGYGRWSYSDNADALCAKIKRSFSGITVTPKDQDTETQKAIAASYTGHHANEAGSFPTPERLLKTYVEYSRDDQGLSLFRSLFSTVYSHALYCAKTKNTQTLVNDLLPIYSKRNEPINFDNGPEILSEAVKNPFVAIIHKMQPFEFSSTQEYVEARNKAKQRELELANETPEQMERRLAAHREYTNEMIKRICSDTSLDEKDKVTNTFIDSIKPEFARFTLA